MSPNERQILHNRLTHSLEVAQIGRRLAQYLSKDRHAADSVGGIDPDVVESAALAHDLGHPPFGHVAEEVLNQRCKDILKIESPRAFSEGFNGNAQSFRIVTKLEQTSAEFVGLNLSRATLGAILKYPWQRETVYSIDDDSLPKWGAYWSESEDFEWACEGKSVSKSRTAEAELVDWADDVAYAVHDLEDFYRAGLIPLDRLSINSGDNDEAEQFVDAAHEKLAKRYSREQVKEAFRQILPFLPFEPYKGTRRNQQDVRGTTSRQIARYIGAISLNTATDASQKVVKEADLQTEVDVLKRLTWHYVIHNPAIATQQIAHKRVIGTLFDAFAELAHDKSAEARARFPYSVREKLVEVDRGEALDLLMHSNKGGGDADKRARIRVVVDYIASMTEQQAIDMFARLVGTGLGSAMDPIIP